MNNKKGEIGVGIVIVIAIIAIVGMVIFQTIAQYSGESTSTDSWVNYTVSLGATTYTDIQGAQNIVGSYTIYNASNSTQQLGTNNVTVVERVGNDGQLTLAVQVIDGKWNSRSINITGTYGPDGYVSDSGARSITTLIILMTALALAVTIMVPSVRETLFSYFDI